MPQYGYAIAGVQKNELSDIAQHQYLVALFAWQLALNLNSLGANFNVQRVLELALTHDLGELFGSDISFYYARKNKKARTFAKKFEMENIKFMSKFFGKDKNYFQKLLGELHAEKSDESLLVKVADYIEATHYKYIIRKSRKDDVLLTAEAVSVHAKKIKNPLAREKLLSFTKQWAKDLPNGDTVDVVKGI